MDSGALILVDQALGSRLYKLDKEAAIDCLLHDDTLVNYIKKIYEIPRNMNEISTFFIACSYKEVESFLSTMSDMRFDNQNSIFHEIMDEVRKFHYNLIYLG